MAMKRMLILSPQDNVGVLLEEAKQGDTAVCELSACVVEREIRAWRILASAT